MVAVHRLCSARDVGMNEPRRFCLQAGLGTVATGYCAAWLGKALPSGPLPFLSESTAEALDPTGWWGCALSRGCQGMSEVFPAHTYTTSFNVIYSVFGCLIVLWPPTASRGSFCFWDLLWVEMFLPLFFLKKASLQDWNPTKSAF